MNLTIPKIILTAFVAAIYMLLVLFLFDHSHSRIELILAVIATIGLFLSTITLIVYIWND